MNDNMIENMQSKVDEIVARFDKRTDYCELSVAKAGDGRWRLTGRALDEANLAEIVDALSRAYGDQTFESADVEILRPGRPMTVGTGVTGLYAGPSFGNEMASQ